MGELWATTTLTDNITGTILGVWIVYHQQGLKRRTWPTLGG
jgi:hypothetical protein